MGWFWPFKREKIRCFLKVRSFHFTFIYQKRNDKPIQFQLLFSCIIFADSENKARKIERTVSCPATSRSDDLFGTTMVDTSFPTPSHVIGDIGHFAKRGKYMHEIYYL